MASSPDTDRCRHGVAEQVTILFGLTRPEPVLSLLACEVATCGSHRALVAEALRLGLTSGAGLGVGLMTFATAEPVGLWGSNPMTVSGEVAGNSEDALQSAYRYTFAHYGFHA